MLTRINPLMFLILLLIISFSCRKSSIETPNITFEELNNLYLTASMKLRKLKSEKSQITVTRFYGSTYGNDTMISTLFTEAEAEAIIAPLINPTIIYLQQNYSINILEDFSANDPNIVIVGSAALRLDALEVENRYVDTTTINITAPSGPSLLSEAVSFAFSEKTPDWYDCALRSLGIEAAVKMFDSGFSSAAKATMKKSALRKTIIKVASRTLGIVGAAIAVYEFGDCMNWW